MIIVLYISDPSLLVTFSMPESTVAGDDATTIAVVGTGAITVGILDMIDELLRLYGERIVFFETHQFDET